MNVAERLRSSRILAVFRLSNGAPDPVEQALRLVAAGVEAVEYTMDSPDALHVITRLRDELDASILIGAGTVTGVEQLGPLRDIGIEFIVSPHTDENLITESLNLGLEPIPGVLSPTEVHKARDAGATILKLFPAGPMGVSYLRAIRAPFPEIDWIPMGGISPLKVEDWLGAGALCVGIGAALSSASNPESLIRDLVRTETT